MYHGREVHHDGRSGLGSSGDQGLLPAAKRDLFDDAADAPALYSNCACQISGVVKVTCDANWRPSHYLLIRNLRFQVLPNISTRGLHFEAKQPPYYVKTIYRGDKIYV